MDTRFPRFLAALVVLAVVVWLFAITETMILLAR